MLGDDVGLGGTLSPGPLSPDGVGGEGERAFAPFESLRAGFETAGYGRLLSASRLFT